ncbi:MAG: hypothetical protein WCA27_07350 [Candidatus Sulfotelmatobacter sp.]
MVTWRRMEQGDRPLVQGWLDKDEIHKASGLTVDKLFEDDTEAWIIYSNDKPLMAVRRWKMSRFAAQFNPDTPYQTAKAAKDVLQKLEEMAESEDCIEVACRPAAGRATNFVERLGFVPFVLHKKDIGTHRT